MNVSSSRPPASSGSRRLTLVAVATLVVALDQATKHWALSALGDGDIELFWTLRLNLAFNAGAAFSIGSRGGLFSLVGLAVVAVVFRSVLQWRTRWAPVALGSLLGGALGNLVDRIFRAGDDAFLGGYVVDFIDPRWWPVFNVADIGISVGGVLLVVLSSRHDKDAEREAQAAAGGNTT